MQIRSFIKKTLYKHIWSVDEIKSYLRIIDNIDDHIISSMIISATTIAERFTNLSLFTREIKLNIERFSGESIESQYNPIIKLSNIKILSSSLHKAQELIEPKIDEDYLIIGSSIFIKDKYIRKNIYNKNLEIEILAGYENNEISPILKQAILTHVVYLYENDSNIDDQKYLNDNIYSLYKMCRHANI